MNVLDVALFAAAIRLSVPLVLAALGELVSERAGVINIGLEGMMLFGAYAGFLATYATGSVVVGLLGGVGAGLAAGAVMALVAVTLRGDQIVAGVAVNLLAAGLTLFLYRLQFGGDQPTTARLEPFAVPLLSRLPVVGAVLFTQLPLVYLAYVLGPAVAFLLYRTRHGLLLRAAGETPEAVVAAGYDVLRVQWAGVLVAGGLTGLGGAFLSVGQVGLFAEDMTAGRGFLALAAVVFGRWRPYGVVGACLVFGFTDAVELRLQSLPTVPRDVWLALAAVGVGIGVLVVARVRSGRPGARRFRADRGSVAAAAGAAVLCVLLGVVGAVAVPRFALPSQFWLCLPYVLSLVALAASARGGRGPAMLGRPARSAAS